MGLKPGVESSSPFGARNFGPKLAALATLPGRVITPGVMIASGQG